MTQQQKLYEWIADIYSDRLIRVSGEPYLSHLKFVAEFVEGHLPFGYEIGLSHDLLEDFELDRSVFGKKLSELGYVKFEADYISSVVEELTTVYTKTAFPDLSKKKRRKLEDHRLQSTSPEAQTVKYGDLFYNAEWTVKYEPEKADKYLLRKQILLKDLNKGNPQLWQKTVSLLERLISIQRMK